MTEIEKKKSLLRQLNFERRILECSNEKEDVKKAIDEWDFLEKVDYIECVGFCICSRKLKYVNFYYNIINSNVIQMGGTCKKVFDKNNEKEKKERKKSLKQRAAMKSAQEAHKTFLEQECVFTIQDYIAFVKTFIEKQGYLLVVKEAIDECNGLLNTDFADIIEQLDDIEMSKTQREAVDQEIKRYVGRKCFYIFDEKKRDYLRIFLDLFKQKGIQLPEITNYFYKEDELTNYFNEEITESQIHIFRCFLALWYPIASVDNTFVKSLICRNKHIKEKKIENEHFKEIMRNKNIKEKNKLLKEKRLVQDASVDDLTAQVATMQFSPQAQACRDNYPFRRRREPRARDPLKFEYDKR